MRVEKRVLNDALRVLGKVVCQTSPVELYRSIRFVGDENGIRAMATDGVETVLVILDAFTETEIDFCVPFKELKDLVRMGRSETIELTGKFIEFPELEEPSADAISAILPVNFGELLTQAASVVDRSELSAVVAGYQPFQCRSYSYGCADQMMLSNGWMVLFAATADVNFSIPNTSLFLRRDVFLFQAGAFAPCQMIFYASLH